MFDIDGTLLRRVVPGDGIHRISLKERAFMSMVRRLWALEEGFYTRVIGRNLRGMTDFEIILELTGRMGIDREEVIRRSSEVKGVLIEEFQKLSAEDGPRTDYRILPGAREILVELKSRSVKLGLATGNLEHFARHKLRSFDIEHFFAVGGFGDDGLRRSEIVSEAVRKGSERVALLVGDTPADIEAGRACQIKVIAVATGGYPAAKLAQHSPDLLLGDLTEKKRILDFIGLDTEPAASDP